MSKGWKSFKLGDVIELFDYKRIPMPSVERDNNKGIYPYYGATGILDYINDYIFDGKYILLGEDGTVMDNEKHPIVQLVEGKFWVNNHAHIFKVKEGFNLEYIYYTLKFLNVEPFITGSVQLKINQNNLKSITILIPPLKEQQKIADLLSSLDNKIELNNQINKDLEELAQTLYTKWFVNFDFPNEEGKPYKSNGGEMIDSELGEIPIGWSVGKLGDRVKVSTGKKDANYGTLDGKYDFFTCSKEPIKAPDYSFDTKAILLAGNGEFWLRWVEGKFEAYQRTYVIESKESNEFEYILYSLKRNLSNITRLSTGSIIKYLKLGMITNNTLLVPTIDIIERYHIEVNKILEEIKLLDEENIQLKETRDLLLPYLMSGKIKLN